MLSSSLNSLASILLLQALQQNATPRPTPHTAPGPDLTNLMLLALLNGNKPKGGRKDPEKTRLQGLLLRDFCRCHYLPERNHSPTGPTAELTDELLGRLLACFGREIQVKELGVGTLKSFRAWLAQQVALGLSPATANLRLRQLRAVWNHAARWQYADSGKRWRTVKPPPPIDFFPESEPEVDAWTEEQLDAIDRQARAQTGLVGDVPADVFWVAWELVFRSMGSRVTATMLCRREDYDWEAKTLLLRRETQKQKQDQRIALPPVAAEAVERLLAAHDHKLVFGCWPYDSPRAGQRRHWRVLVEHFVDRLLTPIGITLPAGVKTRQWRRTAATIVTERNGNAQQLLGHSSPRVTARYKDRKRQPICRESLLMPDAPALGEDPGR